MSAILERARTLLQSHGLRAEEYNAQCLNEWATDSLSVGGLKLSHDMTRLYANETHLTVQFPGPGQCRYEVTGEPAEILQMVLAVYARYFKEGGTLAEAVAKSVPESESFLSIRPGR
jgi:hypothetical protein